MLVFCIVYGPPCHFAFSCRDDTQRLCAARLVGLPWTKMRPQCLQVTEVDQLKGTVTKLPPGSKEQPGPIAKRASIWCPEPRRSGRARLSHRASSYPNNLQRARG